MKKILIALLIVVSMLAVSACSRSVSETASTDVSSADVSASDTSATDASSTDTANAVPAPAGYVGCEIGDIYFCYSEDYTLISSADNAVNVSADTTTGANLSVTKSEAVELNVSELSRTDLDAIGEKGAAELEAIYGEGVDAVYTYANHGSVLDGKGVYFTFDITVTYTELDFSQTYSYYQMFIGEGKDLYMLTFATNTAYDDTAEVYFADVIESVELKTAVAE